MQEIKLNRLNNTLTVSKNFLYAALGLVSLVVLIGFIYLILDGNIKISFPDAYILPWVLLPFISIIAPWVYLIYIKKFSLFNPLVYAGWTYFLPAFVGGGIILAAGWSQPYFLVFIQHPRYDIPLALGYIAIGYLSLSLGYFLPYGERIGTAISKKLPEWNWSPSKLLIPSMLLLAIGLSFNMSAFLGGLLGYQKLEQIGVFDALQYFLTLIIVEASFILWMIIFKSPKRDFRLNMLLILLIALIPIRMVLLGSRSSLMLSVFVIAAAFAFSGRKLKLIHGVILSVFLILSLMVGAIYGTTFRVTKGSQEKVSVEEYLDSAVRTFDKIGTQDFDKTLNDGFYALAERVDGLSSLAVVVSNYEKLTPYEGSIGLDNHIWNYTWTAFIPRFLWSDKPIISDARGYGELYFNYGDNAFAVNVVGDLLRNYGPLGIPIGMVLLGFFIRVIYAALIENTEPTIWRAMMYYMLLTIIYYEGFYGAIMPLIIRVGIIATVSLLFMRFLIGKGKKYVYTWEA
jgi:hypothetical protein